VHLNPEQARQLCDVALEALEAPPAMTIPDGTFGTYRITRLVGRGGMGEVYEAEQDRTGRRVAVKVVRPEMLSADLARRFEHEVRVLARLRHPGIAQVFEAGRIETGQGPTPYFAMEYVEGQTLTAYATKQGLAVDARLELFLKVCDAVEHAHRMGVIHRDLKPDNILVDAAGQPRILDFGVAGATDSDVHATTMHTEVGRVLGTLPYMSPEQIAGNPDALDTRSDVYSLGVVLYELLAGKLPYDITRSRMHEAARVIKEEEPAKLGTVDRILRGDVETIVGRAMEKEAGRRYQSVGDLAADLRRYLADEPIRARPPSASYQLSKFVSRNKGLSIGLAAAAAALAVGMAGTIWQAVRATNARAGEAAALVKERERRVDAEMQATTARRTVDFMEKILSSTDPYENGASLTLEQLVSKMTASLETELAGEPEIAARVRTILARAYSRIGRHREALEMSQEAAGWYAKNSLPGDRARREGDRQLAICLRDVGKYDDAESVLRSLLGRTPLASSPPLRSQLLAELSTVIARKGDSTTALALAREAQAAVPQERTGFVDRMLIQKNLIMQLAEAGSIAEASGECEVLLQQARAELGDRNLWTLSLIQQAGELRADLGSSEEAIGLLRECLEGQLAVLGEDTPAILATRTSLATILSDAGHLPEADTIMRQCLDSSIKINGPDHADTLVCRSNLAGNLMDLGQFDEANKLFAEVLRISTRDFGEGHPSTIETMAALAVVAGRDGRPDEALTWIERASVLAEANLAENHPLRSRIMGSLAVRLAAAKKYEPAERAFVASIKLLRAQRGEGHIGTIAAADGYIKLLTDTNRYPEAITLAEYWLPIAARSVPAHTILATLELRMGRLLLSTDRAGEAEPHLARAWSIFSAAPGDRTRDLKNLASLLVSVYEKLERPEDAAKYRAVLDPDWKPPAQPNPAK
jgi:tetratricopeptide (TPR) repeat protein/tRNA A-37 threonylcarbamoyl transferase component Bud32